MSIWIIMWCNLPSTVRFGSDFFLTANTYLLLNFRLKILTCQTIYKCRDMNSLARAAVSGDEKALDMFTWNKASNMKMSSGPAESRCCYISGTAGKTLWFFIPQFFVIHSIQISVYSAALPWLTILWFVVSFSGVLVLNNRVK